MTYPACFPTHKAHGEWVHLARMSHEVCSICDDCTADYEKEMRLQERCSKDFWQLITVNRNARQTNASSGHGAGAGELPSESVAAVRLQRVRQEACDRAREYLARNPAAVQTGGWV